MNPSNGSRGIFSGSGSVTTTITVTSLPFAGFGKPSINQAGTVAFAAFPHSGFEDGIYAGNGGPLTTIADPAGPLRDFAGGYITSIDATGTVAFWASQDSGPAGIFAGNGGAVTPIFLNSPSASVDFNISMNDAGTFAFRSGNGARVVTAHGGLITTIAADSGPLNYFGTAPSLNSDGTVAFVAGVDGVDGGVFGINKGNGGPVTTIADLSGPYSYLGDFYSYQPSINAAGTVAFSASLDAGGFGIYTGAGAATSEVIGSGDALFGSTITGLGISPASLNDPGQVACYYELANGTTGIAIANSVPESGSASLLLGGLLAILAPRRRRAQ